MYIKDCTKHCIQTRFFKNILEGYIKVSNNGTFEMNYVGKANNFNIFRLGIMYSDFSMSCPWMSELIDRLVYKKTSMHCMDLITF